MKINDVTKKEDKNIEHITFGSVFKYGDCYWLLTSYEPDGLLDRNKRVFVVDLATAYGKFLDYGTKVKVVEAELNILK